MSDELDLDALEARAKAATPGPWEVRDEGPSMGGENFTLRQAGVPGIKVSGYVYGFGTGIQEFIAAANPATVLALIERVKAAEAGEFKQRRKFENMAEFSALHQRQRDAALARIAKIEALHQRKKLWIDDRTYQLVCQGCKEGYPCATVHALTEGDEG